MKKNPASKAGVFNARALFAFILCTVGSLLAMLSFASAHSNTESGLTVATSSFGGPDPTVPGNPRYQIFSFGINSGSGEFNIGFNPATGHIFTMNSGSIYRINA